MPSSRFALICLVWAAACRGPAAFPTDEAGDTDVHPGGDSDDVPVCDGSLTLSFAGASVDPIAEGAVWVGDGITWQTSGFMSGKYEVHRDEQGCIVLGVGTLTIDLLDTGCAASTARVTLTDHCGPACSVVRVWAAQEKLAESRNVGTGVEQNFVLKPSEPFGSVEVGSVDAVLCAVSVDLAPMPDSLRPEDTASPF